MGPIARENLGHPVGFGSLPITSQRNNFARIVLVSKHLLCVRRGRDRANGAQQHSFLLGLGGGPAAPKEPPRSEKTTGWG